jgi:hypothetical protein
MAAILKLAVCCGGNAQLREQEGLHLRMKGVLFPSAEAADEAE